MRDKEDPLLVSCPTVYISFAGLPMSLLLACRQRLLGMPIWHLLSSFMTKQCGCRLLSLSLCWTDWKTASVLSQPLQLDRLEDCKRTFPTVAAGPTGRLQAYFSNRGSPWRCRYHCNHCIALHCVALHPVLYCCISASDDASSKTCYVCRRYCDLSLTQWEGWHH